MKELCTRILGKIIHLLSSLKTEIMHIKVDVNSPSYVQHYRVKKWLDDKGEMTLRFDYPLTNASVVFDLGGYEGQWASDLYSMYNCTIYIFEPYLPFAENIKKRFRHNANISIFAYGLGAKTERVGFVNLDNSSKIVNVESKNNKEFIDIVSVMDFLRVNNIDHVDLVKINIEGAEYDLLESIIDNHQVTLFKNIQIQFHDFLFPNAKERMDKIKSQLSKTHTLTYEYEFVWENWQLK